MKVFHHHIYEYKKGLRNLILHTTKAMHQEYIEKRLKSEKIDYIIHKITSTKINIFFGNKDCIETLRLIDKSNLNEYTEEEDFILGIMLGYDRALQCKRYIKRKSKLFNIKKAG